MTLVAATAAAGWLVAAATAAQAGAVLDHVRAAGQLACAVLSEPADETELDTHGPLPDLGRDICRAVAAAVLGDGDKLRLVFYPDEQHGLAATRAGDVDMLLGATPRLSAGPVYGVAFGRPVFFDGQGFLVSRSAHVTQLADLAGKPVCFISGSEAETALTAELGARHIAFRPFPFAEMGEMEAALVTGHCVAMTGDVSVLADARAEFHARAADFDILGQRITLDPVAPAWRDADPAWGRIVDWTVSALIAAEQAGLRRTGVAHLGKHPDAAAQAVLDGDRLGAQVLGLAPGWSLRAIAAVGNYGELFQRDLGDGSSLRLPRGPNAVWTAGGLLYALPMR